MIYNVSVFIYRIHVDPAVRNALEYLTQLTTNQERKIKYATLPNHFAMSVAS
jgi:hypothetical protein